jgi:cytochrome c peroxidase
MRNSLSNICAVLLICMLAGVGCSRQASQATIDPARLHVYAALPEVVPPKMGELTEEQIALGRMLYYEPRLSLEQKTSCNTCHDLSAYGVDGEETSGGHKGQKGTRNSPTVYNAAGHFVQFWDGRAPDVEEQAKGPVMNPVEMAMPSEKEVMAVLRSMPGYVEAFRKAFPRDKDPVSFNNMAVAIGAFERKLLTPARWDKFLGGDQAALTAEEKAGFNAFAATGCPTCHIGAYVGGNLYQKLGLMKPYPDQSDLGRYLVTKADSDKMFFKVPSLRNIEKTGPYFHNGKVETLEKAVSEMGEYELGKLLSQAEVQSIVTWLKSLTGEVPAEYIKPPELPKATARTPKATEG